MRLQLQRLTQRVDRIERITQSDTFRKAFLLEYANTLGVRNSSGQLVNLKIFYILLNFLDFGRSFPLQRRVQAAHFQWRRTWFSWDCSEHLDPKLPRHFHRTNYSG